MSGLSRGRLHSAGRWGAGIALVVAAWVVMVLTPGADFGKQPFPVEATQGEAAEGRNLRLTVLEATGASEISDSRGWRGEGPWLLVGFEAEAVYEESAASLMRIELNIGERTYRATDRALFAAPRERLSIGLPATATAAFELPADALEDTDENRAATVVFAYDDLNHQLDSVITYDVDLTELSFDAPAEIPDRTWSR